MERYNPNMIKKLRMVHSLTMQQFADKLNNGTKRQHVYAWESGKARPKGTTLEKIADVFNVPISFFYDKDISYCKKSEPIHKEA